MRRQHDQDRNEDVATILVAGPHPQAAPASVISGRGEDDVLTGTNGRDLIVGRGGDDQLFGRGGRDILIGGAGADLLDGGDGIDVADYRGANAISVAFDASGVSTVHVAGEADDTIRSIERVNGSDAGDTFDMTAAQPKTVSGGLGDDLFYVDPLTFNPTELRVHGGAGTDTLDLSRDSAPADFEPEEPVEVFLPDTRGIENVIGSRFDDDIAAAVFSVTTLTVHGMDGDDRIESGEGIPVFLFGDAGDDLIERRGSQGEVHGGDGDDGILFTFSKGSQKLASPLLVDGGDGNDVVSFDGITPVPFTKVALELGRNGEDGTYRFDDGTAGVLRSIENVDQSVYLGVRATIYGNEASNVLIGSRSADVIAPNGVVAPRSHGDDTVDVMTGGFGADTFLITNVDSTSGQTIATDRITDFGQDQDDLIDVSQVDADSSTPGVNRFTFIGNAAFSGVAGELRFENTDGSTIVMADTDGDKIADFSLQLEGTITLVNADFVL